MAKFTFEVEHRQTLTVVVGADSLEEATVLAKQRLSNKESATLLGVLKDDKVFVIDRDSEKYNNPFAHCVCVFCTWNRV